VSKTQRNPVLFATITQVALGILITLVSLFYRLPNFTKSFWEDEVHHNYPILARDSIKGMISDLGPQYQPLLEYLFRRIFWFPVFGNQEWAIRLPGFVYGTLLPVMAFFLALRFFTQELNVQKENTSIRFYLLTLALGIAAWATLSPVQIFYSSEARHYIFASFVSVLWISEMVLNNTNPFSLKGFALSFLFLNTHFFSIPLIAGQLLVYIFQNFRQFDKWNWLKKLIGFALLLGPSTLILNYRAWYWMLVFHPPGSPASTPREGVWQGLSVLGNFPEFLNINSFVLIGLIAFLFFQFKNKTAQQLLFLSVVMIPAFIIYSRLRSTYPFGIRYLSPFYGLGFGLLCFTFATVYKKTFAQDFLIRTSRITGTLVFGITVLLFSIQGYLSIHKTTGASAIPPQNFSPYYQIYKELKELDSPLFLLQEHCWANDIPLLYFNFIQPKPTAPYQIFNSTGCENTKEDTQKALSEFLNREPKGLIVLDQKHSRCENPTETVNALSVNQRIKSEKISVSRIQVQPSCVWIIKGAKTLPSVKFIADFVRFPYSSGLF
jgi:hypothetical protein